MMAAKVARKVDPAETPAPARPPPGTAAPRGSLDPLIQALTRAVDRQAPARPSVLRKNRSD
jgi:hypothetical protein